MLFAALVPLVACVAALKGASPLILVSEERKLNNENMEGSYSVMDEATLVQTAVKNCDYDAYLFVDQPGVEGREIHKASMPHLSHLIDKSEDSSIRDLVMNNGLDDAFNFVKTECGAKEVVFDSDSDNFAHYVDSSPRVFNVQFSAGDLAAHDEILYHILGRLPTGNILLIYRPHMGLAASMEGSEVSGGFVSQSRESSLDPLSNSLFENYQFLSPGILTGILVIIILYPILHIAVKAVSSLQITTKAFEKQEKPSQSKQG